MGSSDAVPSPVTGGGTPPCVLCGASGTKHIQNFSTSDLIAAYRRLHAVDVSTCLTMESIALILCETCDLRFFSPAASGNVAFYRAISRLDGYYMDQKPEFRIARKFIRRGDFVLEVGGGGGGFGNQLEGVDYVGLEFNDDAVKSAQARGVRMLGETLEQHAAANSGKYDAVCAFQVLEHVADPRGLLERAMQCLKPGGRLLLSVPSHDSFLRLAPNLVLNMPPHHVSLWSDRALLSLGNVLDCRVEDMVHETVAPYHYAWFLATALMSLAGSRHGSASLILDLSRGMRLKYLAAAVAGRVLAFILHPFLRCLPSEFAARGHAVVVVLRK